MTQMAAPSSWLGALLRPWLQPPGWHSVRKAAGSVALYLLCIALAFGIAGALVAATGHSPASAFTAVYNGALGSQAAIGATIDEATPLLLVALGTVVATRAGLFNIGQEGQLTIGALLGGVIALKVPGPGPVVLVLALVGAAVGGALWAGIAALLRYWRGVDVVISTLLLVFIAEQVIAWSVNASYLLREKVPAGQISSPESNPIPNGVRLPHIGTYPSLNFGSGFFLAIVLTVLVAFVLRYTPGGFRLKMLGMNPLVAQRMGVRAMTLGSAALVVSGAFAGLAGGVVLTSSAFTVQPAISNNLGFDGLLVALVARSDPLLAFPVALVFGGLRSGGGLLATTGVPSYIVDVVKALLVLAMVFPPAYQEIRANARARALARARARAVEQPVEAAA